MEITTIEYQKKMRLVVFTLAIFVFAFVSSCSNPSKKLDDSKENLVDAKKEFIDAQADYQADIEKFKQESNERILMNEKQIVSMNEWISKNKKAKKLDYKDSIAILEQKNKDLKTKMENYKPDSKTKWESFKTEFNHDMDELGTALKNLSVDNEK